MSDLTFIKNYKITIKYAKDAMIPNAVSVIYATASEVRDVLKMLVNGNIISVNQISIEKSEE